MDVLELLREAESAGGLERRQALSYLMKTARDMGCSLKMGNGKVPSLNVRYGAHGWSVVDATVKGEVFVHLNADASLQLSDEERATRRTFLLELEGVTMKSADINHYGQTVEKLEEIPSETMRALLRHAVDNIQSVLAEQMQSATA